MRTEVVAEPVLRELPPEDARFRLRPRAGDGDEEALAEADEQGRRGALNRTAQRLGGFRLDQVFQTFDTASATIVRIDDSFLSRLELPQVLDGALVSMDARPGHVRLADGSRRPVLPQNEDVLTEPVGESGTMQIRPFATAAVLEQGLTLVANNLVPRVGGELRRFCHDASRVTGVPAQVNCYLSDARRRGSGVTGTTTTC